MPTVHEDHIIERDSSSAGMWALAIVVVVLLLLLAFRFNVFGHSANSMGNSAGTHVNGTVNTPSGTYQGSGNVTQ